MMKNMFGFESEQVSLTTFGMNEKGGMNAIELDKCHAKQQRVTDL